MENIPAMVCSRCGEEVFRQETTEQVGVMLQEPKQPSRSISNDQIILLKMKIYRCLS
ncbi:MAG: YgiT-type zinc finger protein [Cyanobacteria bacterium WB6_1B_304]|nr:YgiT-type zinc finger protein [Cyanobacteria bacterium WB6_1B_304]